MWWWIGRISDASVSVIYICVTNYFCVHYVWFYGLRLLLSKTSDLKNEARFTYKDQHEEYSNTLFVSLNDRQKC